MSRIYLSVWTMASFSSLHLIIGDLQRPFELLFALLPYLNISVEYCAIFQISSVWVFTMRDVDDSWEFWERRFEMDGLEVMTNQWLWDTSEFTRGDASVSDIMTAATNVYDKKNKQTNRDSNNLHVWFLARSQHLSVGPPLWSGLKCF